MNDEPDKELIAVFEAEASETIDLLVETIVRLRYGNSKDLPEDIGLAFRLAHNLKGAARSVGIEEVDQIAHVVEDLLSPFRETGELPGEGIFNTIVEHIQQIETVLYKGDVAQDENAQVSTEDSDERSQSDAGQPSAEKSTAAAGRYVRLTTERLNDLSNRADDMVTIQGKQEARHAFMSAILADLQTFVKGLPPELRSEGSDVIARLGAFDRRDRVEMRQYARLVDDFRSAMVAVRMQPLGGQSASWRRIVRDIAGTAGKQVRTVINVDNIELDKHVLDSLRDPMVHLIRNAVDHGIEVPGKRKKAGKPEQGTISISARVVGAQVEIDVVDDGRGFDGKKIRDAFLKKEKPSSDYLAALSKEEALDLVFLPGLSTAKSVTTISGRGVGLDVVRTSLEAIGGTAQVIADENAVCGTGIRLRVPISILTSRGLLIRCGASAYIIPSAQVENTLRVESASIRRVDGIDSIALADEQPLPLYSLGAFLGIHKPNDALPEFLNIVVFKDRIGLRGFVVDVIDKVDDFVIKALPSVLPRLPGVNGVAILGDGSLAVEIDLAGVASMAQDNSQKLQVSRQTVESTHAKRVLVVDDSLTSRTLERNILATAGYDVVVAEDGVEAWSILKKEKFVVVVSDVEMPRMNGFELTRKIRANKKTNLLPVILVTSLAKDEHRKEGADAGANAYIVKSRFEQKILLEEVAKYG